MDLDEARTRADRIDVQLSNAGWGSEAQQVNFESEFAVVGTGPAESGFADYALPAADGSVLAVVEAKRSSRDALAGKEQARQYAEAIAARQGLEPFIYLANGDETWFWDLRENVRLVSGFAPRDDLERRLYQRDHRARLGTVKIASRIVNRPYQYEAIRKVHEAFETGHRKALIAMATGTGKTRIATALVDTLLAGGWAQKVLFLADRDVLAQQALSDGFRAHLPAEPSERIVSGRFDGSKRLFVATLQTMQDYYEAFSPAAFDLVIADECHRSIYNRWKDILSYFDAYTVGLTATPSEYLGRDTFAFFGCKPGEATVTYTYEEAVEERWLVPFEAYHARTRYQLQGVHGDALAPDEKQALLDEGLDPATLNLDGSDIERRWTNMDTTRLIVREFFENALTDPAGALPGKSIVFALTHAHARRLYDVFLTEYPQYPGLVEIIDSHMERPGDLIRRFKTEDFPRVAISVDMLDTGIDVPTVVNLALCKPVFSYIKFWQMLGRGMRLVDSPDVARPWCPVRSKDRFRVLDFASNFDWFGVNPEGLAPSTSTPVATRLFRSLAQAARAAQANL